MIDLKGEVGHDVIVRFMTHGGFGSTAVGAFDQLGELDQERGVFLDLRLHLLIEGTLGLELGHHIRRRFCQKDRIQVGVKWE